jgi:hypothetical protein
MLMPSDNTSHERLWRQILRWLSAASPPRLELTLENNTYSPGEKIRVHARVSDKAYQPVTGATVWMMVTAPDGGNREIQLTGSLSGNGFEKGLYAGAFTVRQAGLYGVAASSTDAQDDVLETSTHFLVTPSPDEFIGASMNRALLERMAAAGGGGFYTLDTMDRLTQDVRALPVSHSITVTKDFWHIPPVLIVLILLLSVEWFIRRRKGLS